MTSAQERQVDLACGLSVCDCYFSGKYATGILQILIRGRRTIKSYLT